MTSNRNVDGIQRGIVGAFRFSASISLGLAASFLVIVPSVERASNRFVIALLAGFGLTLLYRIACRASRNSVVNLVLNVCSYVAFAIMVYTIWYYAPGTDADPMAHGQYSFLVLSLLLGHFLAGIALKADPESPPFAELREILSVWNTILAQRVPVSEVLAFAFAVLLSFSINTPTLHPQIQSALTTSSAIVTLSLAWYARLAIRASDKTTA